MAFQQGGKSSFLTSMRLTSSILCRPISRVNPSPIAAHCRWQSTSTMDLVSMDEARLTQPLTGLIHSTIQTEASRDFSSLSLERVVSGSSNAVSNSSEEPSVEECLAALALSLPQEKKESLVQHVHEMDLLEASQTRESYDTILMLVHHGEDEAHVAAASTTTSTAEERPTLFDSLTGQGVGQSLSLSRRTATFCNTEHGLVPQLFLVGASRKVLQTMFLGFPYDTPFHSTCRAQWICHPNACSNGTNTQQGVQYSSVDDLQREFAGIHTALCSDQDATAEKLTEEELSNRAADVVKWLQVREERVVIVSGDATWLNALESVMDSSTHVLQNGEMRVLGIRF